MVLHQHQLGPERSRHSLLHRQDGLPFHTVNTSVTPRFVWGLAATANNFAREVFLDELAATAGSDPLAFRHAHLANPRLRAVLDAATSHFRWQEHANRKDSNTSVGLACGTEKGSYVAACAEIEIDRQQKKLKVRNICEAFECGAIVNPGNLLSQVQGATIMGLGAALREEIQFENGRILNASFGEYRVPRLEDVPEWTSI